MPSAKKKSFKNIGGVLTGSKADRQRKITKAKRDLISKPFRSLTGIVGVISFGLLTGLFTSDILGVVKDLGLIKFGSDFITDTMALGDEDKNMEDINPEDDIGIEEDISPEEDIGLAETINIDDDPTYENEEEEGDPLHPKRNVPKTPVSEDSGTLF